MLPWHIALLWFGRLGRFFEQPRYQIKGACHSNGRCCEKLLLVDKPLLTWPVLRWLTRFWMERVYAFVIHDSAVRDPETGEYFRILSCRNLVDGRCREYWLRPRICRAWPFSHSTNPPVLFNGCGYWACDRDGDPAQDVSVRRGALWEDGTQGLLDRWPKRDQSTRSNKTD